MMYLLLIIAAVGAAFLVVRNADGESTVDTSVDSGTTDALPDSGPRIASNTFGLVDVAPSQQGGSFSQTFDSVMFQVATERGVPFALIKAHAIRESSLKPNAFHADTPLKASYGLMQVEWWKNSNRFQKWGYGDDRIGDGSILYDPYISCTLGAYIIADNLTTFGNLRDAVNAYNTGTTEAKHEAPANYVNDVLGYYSTLTGENIT